ncbi:unnamed protein product [Adineta steineri]|uniref:Endonuclease/exonuclease/phosphatase domain-containing protein n=1 Tax=Adineta steineri TaxID=433720 RepID=A0A814YDT1_9BILA|nr:unnamed protein product [Adineta steineri]
MLFIIFSLIIIAVLIGFLFIFPRYTEEDDLAILKKYQSIKEGLLSVMTFNIRFDGPERDPNNHFTKRIFRLTETIKKWEPSILSVQEPFADQLRQWHSHLPKHYQYIGYQPDDADSNLVHPLSHMYFQVAILYNNHVLTLLEQDYIWLSKSPRIVGSKDWDSHGARTLNIARFKLNNDDNSTNILVFNTHLDVRSEQARREQAKIIRSTIKQWQKKYPKAMVLLFGDFNSVPKQTTYNILTSSHFLNDTWTVAKTSGSMCVSNTFSSTFHGWLGSTVNTYGFQIALTILYTFHGLGVKLLHGVPTRPSFIIDVLKQLWKVRRTINLSEIISLWSSYRLHVDWILYQDSMDRSQHLQPRFVAVVDIRSKKYSSDHFPVVALFQIKNES